MLCPSGASADSVFACGAARCSRIPIVVRFGRSVDRERIAATHTTHDRWRPVRGRQDSLRVAHADPDAAAAGHDVSTEDQLLAEARARAGGSNRLPLTRIAVARARVATAWARAASSSTAMVRGREERRGVRAHDACMNCERQTGSAFVINLLIEADRLEVVAGTAHQVDVPRDDGSIQAIFHCPRCAVAVFSERLPAALGPPSQRTGGHCRADDSP